MDKRFVTFLALAFLILTLNAIITSRLMPRRQPAAPDAAGPGGVRAEARPDDAAAEGAAGQSTAEAADEEQSPPAGVQVAEAPPQPDAPAGDAIEQPAAVVPEKVALGSLNPDDGYRMLVVLTNVGAGIERCALSSDRYTNPDDRSGYLGPLDESDALGAAGCRIGLVPPGTAAAEAGLQPGDVITKIDDVEIKSADDLSRYLARRRPRQQVALSLIRNGQTFSGLKTRLRPRPLEVMRPERENLRARRAKVPADLVDPPSLGLSLRQIDGADVSEGGDRTEEIRLRGVAWEIVERSETGVTFRRVLPGPRLEVRKRFELVRVPAGRLADRNYPGYSLDFSIEFRNLGDTPRTIAYRLDGPSGLPIEGWWYASKISRNWSGAGLRDVVVRFAGAETRMISCLSIVGGKTEPMGQGASLMFAGVDAQYFAAVLVPRKSAADELWFDETHAVRVDDVNSAEEPKNLTNVTCTLSSRPQTVEPAGAPMRHEFVLFAGPKAPDLLAHYGQPADPRYNLGDLVYYGWFGWVARPMLAILHGFYRVVGNYGIAIVLLTVLVRGGMFPLSLKQTKNMQKMQELQPEMKRIAERYKGDVEKRTKEQQNLFRKHKYNPMGGCLVMFIQLPIFLGLYRSLMVDVELRQAPLLGRAIRWCSNLAAPDMLFDWSSFMPRFVTDGVGLFGLGPYLNVLPIVTIGLFIVQQKMFMPPPADEQAAMQQKIMKYMMVFMGLLFFKVASGLCIYFIASSLWGLAERRFLPKSAIAESASVGGPATDMAGGNGREATGASAARSHRQTRQKPRRR